MTTTETVTKAYPILFSGPMVKAILEGRKTQTRRVCKEAYDKRAGVWADAVHPAADGMPIFWWHLVGGAVTGQAEISRTAYPTGMPCPYGQPGDRLWVRETFVVESNRDSVATDTYPPPFKDGRPTHWQKDYDGGDYWQQCHYRATDPTPELHYMADEPGCRWRPSIFMPRWASRITLEITDVRVERVQGISETDAEAEGIEPWSGDPDRLLPHQKFRYLWDSINGSRPGCSWQENPYVWVVSFTRVQP